MSRTVWTCVNVTLKDEHGNALDGRLESTWNDAILTASALSAQDFYRLPPQGQRYLVSLFRRMADELEWIATEKKDT